MYLCFFILDSPRCKPGTEQTSIGAINMHSIPVKCEVDADPPDSVKFSWTYNNTRNVSPVSREIYKHINIYTIINICTNTITHLLFMSTVKGSKFKSYKSSI